MIPVSNEFKKAIKDRERRIKGYVEVIYELIDLEPITEVTGMTSTNTNPSEISNGIRVENDYGTVDYLPLDGSKLVMGDTNTHSGFISDDLVEMIVNPEVTLSLPNTEIKGMTFYFRDNYPHTINLTFSDSSTMTLQDIGELTQQILFDEPKAITSVTATFSNWEYQDRKIKIMEIDLGITQVYKDQDLIEFTVDEEVNKLVEETPINEVDITLNNMQDLFNPLNPQGIVKYLDKDVKIIPYIGVLTETSGVEYVKMGEFYFDSYTNNSDKTTTLIGKNLIVKLENEELRDDNETSIGTTIDQTKFLNLMDNYPYINFNVIDWSGNVIMRFIKNSKLLNFIKDVSFLHSTLFIIDRNNNVNMKNLDNEIKDSITKSELINDAEYKKIDKINTILVNGESVATEALSQSKKIYEEDFILDDTKKVVLINNTSGDLGLATLTQSGGSGITVLFKGSYLSFVKITGNIGDTVKITGTTNYSSSFSKRQYEKNNASGGEKKNILEVDIFSTNIQNYLDYYSKVLEYAPSYEMSFEYNGDPSLEAGDYINVETPYGYKPLFIQKNRFTFNGGLTGSIEGVE